MVKLGKLWRKIRRCGLYLIPLPQFNFYTYGRVQDEIELMYDDIYAERDPIRFTLFCLKAGRPRQWCIEKIADSRIWIEEFKANENKT